MKTRMPSTRTLASLALLISVAVCAGRAAAAERVDPFYLRLLRDGEMEYERGETAVAARDLRLACFGTLDDPPVLARCLVYLSLAQAKLGDRRAWDETLIRLLEAEERLGAYSAAELPAAIGEAFRNQVDAWVPEETLRQYEAFAPLVERKRAARLAGLSSRELAIELQRLMTLEPGQPRWALMLSHLELERGDNGASLAALDGLSPGVSAAVPCLRGQALARLGRCDEAVPELELCVETPTAPLLQEALLGCRLELGRWEEAGRQLAEMPPEVRARPVVERLERRLERDRPAPPPAAPPEETNDAAQPSPESGGTGAPAEASAEAAVPPRVEAGPASAAPSPPEGRTNVEVEQLRQRLANARSAAELEATFRGARQLADRPDADADSRHLAGEIAYRLSRWSEAVHYFDLGGDPGEDSPDLLFYLAVSLYEQGDRRRATATLERCLPRLKTTPFVIAYRDKILGS